MWVVQCLCEKIGVWIIQILRSMRKEVCWVVVGWTDLFINKQGLLLHFSSRNLIAVLLYVPGITGVRQRHVQHEVSANKIDIYFIDCGCCCSSCMQFHVALLSVIGLNHSQSRITKNDIRQEHIRINPRRISQSVGLSTTSNYHAFIETK